MQQKWVGKLMCFANEIVYHRGKDNVVANAPFGWGY